MVHLIRPDYSPPRYGVGGKAIRVALSLIKLLCGFILVTVAFICFWVLIINSVSGCYTTEQLDYCITLSQIADIIN